jgi:hypothetical protein
MLDPTCSVTSVMIPRLPRDTRTAGQRLGCKPNTTHNHTHRTKELKATTCMLAHACEHSKNAKATQQMHTTYSEAVTSSRSYVYPIHTHSLSLSSSEFTGSLALASSPHHQLLVTPTTSPDPPLPLHHTRLHHTCPRTCSVADTRTTVPFASTSCRPRTAVEKEPWVRAEPWVPVHIRPATLCSATEPRLVTDRPLAARTVRRSARRMPGLGAGGGVESGESRRRRV